VIRRDIADPTHVSGQVINLVNILGSAEAIFPEPQVQHGEFISKTGFEFGDFNVHSPDPKTVVFQPAYKVMPNETTRAGHQYPGFSRQDQLQWLEWIKKEPFYRTVQTTGKLRSGFETGKEFSEGCTFVCKTLHCCANVFTTKEPFSFNVTATIVVQLEWKMQ
jgi:hypothetical protein